MYLIVGLGNPDKKYHNTYHNVGFKCLDAFASLLKCEFNKGECRAITAHASIKGERVILAKPITYMNLSGESVLELVNKYKIEKGHLALCYDDADIPLGDLRIRFCGSGGTHNGANNVIKCLQTEDFVRFRVGIGQTETPLADYVLSEIPQKDMEFLSETFDSTAKALYEFCMGHPIQKIMGKYNKKQKI